MHVRQHFECYLLATGRLINRLYPLAADLFIESRHWLSADGFADEGPGRALCEQPWNRDPVTIRNRRGCPIFRRSNERNYRFGPDGGL